MIKASCAFLVVSAFFAGAVSAQPGTPALTLDRAVRLSLTHYGQLRAKANYVRAAKANVKELRREYLPDLNVSGQQDYGTINASFGASYGYRGLSVSSSGPALTAQSWNAAFGALYLANINWDFFAFGRAKEKIAVGKRQLDLNDADLTQATFQQQVRTAGAYLNLLSAQRLLQSQQKNLDRAIALANVVVARAKNGLNPGVDSSLANAEVSNARIALTDAMDQVAQQNTNLAVTMGVSDSVGFIIDTLFVTQVPKGFSDTASIRNHPLIRFYQRRIDITEEQARYYKTLSYPVFSLFSIYQGRGSGFDAGYSAANPDAYTHSYGSGVNPTRSNYLVGLGVTWNLTNPLRVHELVATQKFNARGQQDELDQTRLELGNQLNLSETRIRNALANYREAPVQVKAASDAWNQKTVMYKNGLSNIVDVTQTLFTLNRAETSRDIAFNNVWQALLLKAAAIGDFSIFTSGL